MTVDSRLVELQLISSMYPNSLYFFDENIAAYIEETADDLTVEPDVEIDTNSGIEFVFSFVNHLVDLHMTLPPNYPDASCIKAHVRVLDTVKYSSSQCKRLQVKVNSSLQQFMVNNSQDMVNVLALIQWVEDFFTDPGDEFNSNKETSVQEAKESKRYEDEQGEEKQAREVQVEEEEEEEEKEDTRVKCFASSETSSTVNGEDNEKCPRASTMTSGYSSHAGCSVGKNTQETGQEQCRLWIYSHHIYSSKKRRMIGNLAHQLNLCGFCRPGKPGFICVEGGESDCSQFWLQIRSENWQRISLIERSFPVHEKLFNGFHEIAMTQSDFFKFLKDLKCDELIRGYLGI